MTLSLRVFIVTCNLGSAPSRSALDDPRRGEYATPVTALKMETASTSQIAELPSGSSKAPAMMTMPPREKTPLAERWVRSQTASLPSVHGVRMPAMTLLRSLARA